MKGMILAAGRGVRMRPLTDTVPKALLMAGRRPLIVHLIERLARARIRQLVINVSHLAGTIERELGDGAKFGVEIVYSREPVALETAGGIAYALPLLGDTPFVVANCDVYSDFDYGQLADAGQRLAGGAQDAHLVLVDNPAHHPDGDFWLNGAGLTVDGDRRYTFSGIGIYSPRLFAGIERGTKCALGGLLRAAIARHRVSGERYCGYWLDVGTPERLAELERVLAARAG